MQSVGTDGRVFQFLVFQLNTTDLASNEGIKNLVWVDSDQLLYRHFWCRPVIKRKVVLVSPDSSSLGITADLDFSIQSEPWSSLVWQEGLWDLNSHICLPFSFCCGRLSLCPLPSLLQCLAGPCDSITLWPCGRTAVTGSTRVSSCAPAAPGAQLMSSLLCSGSGYDAVRSTQDERAELRCCGVCGPLCHIRAACRLAQWSSDSHTVSSAVASSLSACFFLKCCEPV